MEIFYVIEGTMRFLVDEEWLAAPRRSFLRVPTGVTHTFGTGAGAVQALST